jgi:DNA-directed RNA polymerase subunit alpha
LEGSAITSIKIAGVNHEFTSVNGVMEDVTEIVLNVKNLTVRMQGPGPKIMKVTASKAGVVTGANIVADPSIEIVDKDKVIATLTRDVNFEMEMVVESGRGYIPAAERLASADRYEQEIGRIAVDAVYSPVTRVRYTTEDTRVGQKTNYDRLILEIWTNGTITPEMALVEAAKILRKHINPFVQYSEVGAETVTGEAAAVEVQPKIDKEMETKLNMPIQELELSVRASNCLESVKVETIRQLVKMTETDLLEIRSFGKTSLREVKRKLADIGLSLGMTGIE